MFTITVTYKDNTVIYYEVKDWEMKNRCFNIEMKEDSFIFLPTYQILEIEVMKNN